MWSIGWDLIQFGGCHKKKRLGQTHRGKDHVRTHGKGSKPRRMASDKKKKKLLTP